MSDLALAPAALTDVRTMVARCLRLSSRNVEGLITAVGLPIMLMLMFVYLFGGALSTGMEYVDYVVPGVLLVCMGFGAASTAVSVSQDLTSGVIDRFRSMDVSGASLVAGHVAASVARNIFSTVLVFGVAFAIGFRTDASIGQWLSVAGILVLFVVALSWLAAAIGIAVHSPEAANGLTFLISFLPYLSSAFVPVHTMPSWLQGFSDNQPVAPVIDSVRALLTGGTVGSAAWHAIAWSLSIIVVSIALSGALFRRRAR